MIVPDVNLLVYAHDEASPVHEPARAWWEDCLSGFETVAIPWISVLGFIRLTSGRSVLRRPLVPSVSIGLARSWFESPSAVVLQPGPRHFDLLEGLFQSSGMTGSSTTDLHLAALAIENQAELHSNDSDFGRVPGLRWRNPLSA